MTADNANNAASALCDILDKYVAECFPEKSRNTKNTDAPWFNFKTKKLTAQKRRLYKKEEGVLTTTLLVKNVPKKY